MLGRSAAKTEKQTDGGAVFPVRGAHAFKHGLVFGRVDKVLHFVGIGLQVVKFFGRFLAPKMGLGLV